MTGQQMIDSLVSILNNEKPDPVFLLQLINMARVDLESRKQWRVLVSLDNSQTVSSATTYTTPIPMPARFINFLNEGSVLLFDGQNDWQNITEIPFEAILAYKTTYGRYAADYKNGNIFFTGLIPKQYTVYQYFIQDSGDITLLTSWTPFPERFQKILPFYAAAMWRLGTDWDDTNARNADENYRIAEQIYKGMSIWDANLAIAGVNAVDYKNDNYPGVVGGRSGGARFPSWANGFGPGF